MTAPSATLQRIDGKLTGLAQLPTASSERVDQLTAEFRHLSLFDWPADGEQRLARLEAELDAALTADAGQPQDGACCPDDAEEPEATWPQPLPLTEAEVAPSMPPDLLPEPLRAWLIDEAERMSVPVEMIAIPAVVSLGAVAGRNIGLYPKRYDTWQVVPNLWGAVIAPPSSMKSPALQEGTRHIERLAADAIAAHEADRHVRDAKVAIQEAKLSKLYKEAAGPSPAITLTEQIAAASQEIEALQRPVKRYTTNDPTVEMATELLRTNERGLLVIRDELVGLLVSCDKPGREGDREFFLEAFNSKANYTVDRIGRGTIHVPALTLSIVGGVQPGKMEAYVLGAVSGGRQSDGLLQRFQLAVYPEPLTDYVHVDRPVDPTVRDGVQRLFQALADLDPAAHPELERQPGRLPGLRFTPEAQEEFDAWFTAHMRRLRSRELSDTPAFQAHLGKYQALVGKLALLFHLIDCVDDVELRPVSAAALRLAIRWTEYLEAHARKLYAPELTRTTENVRQLAHRLIAGELEDGCSVRDIYRRGWRGLKTKASVQQAVEHLAGRGWLRLEGSPSGTGRPTEIIRTNPLLDFAADLDL
ncbi:MAG TPA: YfjI family protein [Trueperaceae bacterium]|nr:YfjI family protein [Trueperaceae bacterium]